LFVTDSRPVPTASWDGTRGDGPVSGWACFLWPPGDEDKTKEALHRISECWRAHGFDTDMARLRYFGERNEAAPYLTDRGWALAGISIRDLLAANDLAPLQDDDMRMGDMLYISGVLNKTIK
jgi:O-methyltransferase involved in polyketide biosynthesis